MKSLCEFVHSCFYNKKIKIILLGFSDGARNALQATRKIVVEGLILWNPIFRITELYALNQVAKEKLSLHPLLFCTY